MRRRRRSAGLSMVEVMLALSILAGGLLIMLTMQIQAMRGGRHGKSTTEAARFAQDRMEELNHRAFAGLVVGGWNVEPALNGTVTGGQGGGVAQVYTRDWRVSVNPDPNPLIQGDTRRLDVRVRWNDANAPPGAPQRSYVISSIRYDD